MNLIDKIYTLWGINDNKPIGKGSCFGIDYNGNQYFISCRHVYLSAQRECEKLFIADKLNTNKKISILGYIKDIYFHPSDSSEKNYDIVIIKINKKIENYRFISVNEEKKINYHNISKIFIAGFPSGYIENLANNNHFDIFIEPKIIKTDNIYKLNISNNNLRFHGFHGELIEAFGTYCEEPLGSGASGSLVFSFNEKILPIGVCIGDFEEDGSNNKMQIFASFKRVLEALATING